MLACLARVARFRALAPFGSILRRGAFALLSFGPFRALLTVGAIRPLGPFGSLRAFGAIQPFGAMLALRTLGPMRALGPFATLLRTLGTLALTGLFAGTFAAIRATARL